MPAAVSEEAIKRGTGKAWSEWMAWFQDANVAEASHGEIARRLVEETDVSGWWAQMLTVAFEQEIGRRVPGQDCDGEYSVSTSKTLNMSMDDALNWWLRAVEGHEEFGDVQLSGEPEVTRTDRWRYWRVRLADGTRVNVDIYEKASGKSSLSIRHEKLESPDLIEPNRAYWKAFLKEAAASR